MGILRFLLAILLLASPALLRAEIPIVELVPGRSAGPLRDAVRFAVVAPDALPDPSLAGSLGPVRANSTQFGKIGDTVIGALRFRNATAQPGVWILTTGRGTLDSFTLYRELPGTGALDPLFDNGDPEALGDRLDRFQAIATEIQLGPGESATYYFRFRDRASSWMPLEVQSYGDFFRERRANIALISAVIFGSLLLVLLNGLIFAVTGRRDLLWLGAAEIAFAVNTFTAEGYATIFLLHRWPEAALIAGQLVRLSFAVLMMQFGRVMLETRRRNPRLDRGLRATVALGLALMAVTLLSPLFGTGLVIPLQAAGWLYTLATALAMPVLGWNGVRRSRVFLPLFIAWSVMAVYITLTALAISGVAPALPVNWHAIGPIGLFECLMATLSVVLHLRQLHLDRVEAEHQARQALLGKLALSEETARLADDRARALGEVKARDLLLEGSAHDTRHVLHALNSAVHFGRIKAGSGNGTDDLVDLLEAAARHLEDIIASSVSVGNRNGRFLALALSDVATTLHGLAEIYRPIAQRDDIALEVGECDAGLALLDEALFARLVSNLLNNALKFTETGRVEMACASEDGLLRLSVSDTGRGMAPQLAAWLNEHAGDAEPIAPGLRLGTGWRAIREVVALMHGSYQIESNENGTTVTVLLPNPAQGGHERASLAELAAKAVPLMLVELPTGAAARTGAGQGVVMVADDASAETRVACAARSQLLLVRPLCFEMLDHPYVRELSSTPAARAFSTS